MLKSIRLFASAGFVAGFLLTVAASWVELFGREGDTAEKLTGILGTGGTVAAFLVRDGVIHHGDDQLGGALQPDDGELSQSHEETPLVAGEHQFLFEDAPDSSGDPAVGICVGTVADLPDTGTEHHGIQYFHCEHQFDRYN